jgi:hypothetical protein
MSPFLFFLMSSLPFSAIPTTCLSRILLIFLFGLASTGGFFSLLLQRIYVAMLWSFWIRCMEIFYGDPDKVLVLLMMAMKNMSLAMHVVRSSFMQVFTWG